jgi:hypothetical protein
MSNSTSSPASYVIYNSPASVAAANKNTPETSNRTAPPSQFPRNLYSGSPFNPSKTQPNFYREAGVIPYPRDTEVDYFMGTERNKHPANFSRFGYPWCENGYCTGSGFPGRYNTPPAMQWMSNLLPVDMAPERFYHGDQVDHNYCDSEAYISSRRARQIRANQ